MEVKTPRVKIYTTQTCPYCVQAKDYLKSKNVQFEEIDVAADHQAAQEITQRSGSTGVPQIDIDGEIIIGFDQDAIDKKLKIENK